jgi:very-short-patch-repair endonuclease
VPLLDYEVDLFWPDARLVVEADGGHHKGERRDRDNERDMALQLAGYLVRRYSWEALRDERTVAEELLELLRRRLPHRAGVTYSEISS